MLMRSATKQAAVPARQRATAVRIRASAESKPHTPAEPAKRVFTDEQVPWVY
jgi:hypothetical protein